MKEIDKITIEEFGIISINEIENHRVEGTLYFQYRIHGCSESQSMRVDIVLESAEFKSISDFRELKLSQLETLLYGRFDELCKSLIKLHLSKKPVIPIREKQPTKE